MHVRVQCCHGWFRADPPGSWNGNHPRACAAAGLSCRRPGRRAGLEPIWAGFSMARDSAVRAGCRSSPGVVPDRRSSITGFEQWRPVCGQPEPGHRDNRPVQGWCPVQPRACAGYRDAARGQGRMPASWTRSPGPVRRGSRCPSQVSSRAKPAAGLRCPTIRSSAGVTGSGSRSGPPRLRAKSVRYGGETRGLPRRTPPVFRAGENALPRE